MGNRIRPRCAECQAVMDPAYRKGPRGKALVKIPDTFHCREDGTLARGRRKVRFLPSR